MAKLCIQLFLVVLAKLALCSNNKLDFVEHKFNFVELQRTYSRYFHGRFPNRDSSFSINSSADVWLRKYQELFNGCLLHLINYDGWDLPPDIDHPIVLSRYDVIRITYLARHSDTRLSLAVAQSRIFPFEILQRRKASNQHQNETLPSPAGEIPFCHNYNSNTRCNDFPYVQNAMRSRPWVCEAHLYLNPPDDLVFYESDEELEEPFLIAPGMFKRFWHHEVDTSDNLQALLFHEKLPEKARSVIISRPQFDIFINDQNTMVSYKHFEAWTNFLTTHRESFLWYDSYYTASSREMFYSSVRGNDLIWFCRYCSTSKYLTPVPLSLHNFGSYNELLAFTKQINAENLGNTFYNTFIEWGFRKVFQRVSEEYSRTSSTQEYGFLQRFNWENPRWEIEAMLLKSALNNYTFFAFSTHILEFMEGANSKDHGQLTTTGHHPPRKSVDTLLIIYPAGKQDAYPYRFHKSKLKFVSCGSPQIQVGFSSVIRSLLVIFDTRVWIGIGFFIGLTSITGALVDIATATLKDVAKGQKKMEDWWELSWKWILRCLNALLEQGDVTSASLTAFAVRVHFAGFLLFAIVISSCFRDGNISALTLPRIINLDNRFSTLIRHQFQIYTRLRRLPKAESDGGGNPMAAIASHLFQPQVVGRDPHVISNVYSSELYHYAMGATSFKTWRLDLNHGVGIPRRIRHVLEHTRLHPLWDRMLSEEGGYIELRTMKQCNKTALFLPEDEAKSLYQELKWMTDRSRVLLGGDELGLEYEYGITFGRWVNSAVLRRLDGLVSGGLWDWWNHIIGTNKRWGWKMDEKNYKSTLTPISLMSNILVIFIAFLLGLIPTFIVFVLELSLGQRGGAWSVLQRIGEGITKILENFQRCCCCVCCYSTRCRRTLVKGIQKC